MPKYIFDSGPFMLLKHYPPTIFKSFWDKLSQLIENGDITSTSEVLEELKKDSMYDWAKKQLDLFPKPDLKEQLLVQQILAKHKELIKESNRMSGTPVADPFVIARGVSLNIPVVTIEKLKPNAHNIPNICIEMGISYISGLIGLMEKEGWKF